MGLKLELVLVALILITSLYMMSVKLRDHNKRPPSDGKEMEFYDTAFTEVDKEGTLSVSYGVKGKRIDGILYIEDFRYADRNVKFLRADNAKHTPRLIFLDGNVKAKRHDGFKYKTEHALYDKQSDIMQATAPFVAYKKPNMLIGERMRYDVKHKTLYATRVRAIIETDSEHNRTTENNTTKPPREQ